MPAPRSPVTVVLPVTLVVYAALTLAARGLVVAGLVPALAAGIVAALLWTRHPRARFSAYLLLTAVVVRSVARGDWSAAGFAAGAILLLQLPAARAAWPRLRPGLHRAPPPPDAGDRMARP